MENKIIEKLSLHLIKNHNLLLDDEELELIISTVDDSTTHSENIGYFTHRLDFNEKEKAFHDKWLEINEPKRGFNHGHGCLQDLFFDTKGKCLVEITKRDREIVATVIQWLGSNIGFNFLEETLKEAGYKIEID